MTDEQPSDTQMLYKIRVAGNLDQTWSDWFDGFDLTCKQGETILMGSVIDQAALFGVLAKINLLNLPLLLVQRMDNLRPDHSIQHAKGE